MENLEDLVDVKNVGGRIGKLRCDMSMSQESLAEKVNVGTDVICNAENGKLPKKVAIWICLARELKTTIDYLLCEQKNE